MEASGLSLPAGLATPGRVPRLRRQARRCLDTAASVVGLCALAVLLAVGALLATGHSVMIERSDSMLPALAAGDLVVASANEPLEADPGDVITFNDPSRAGKTVTHRVVSRTAKGPQVSFVTKGDRNGGTESWSIARDGRIGMLEARVPKAGYFVSLFTIPVVRFVFVTIAALILGAMVIRRIWSR